MSKKKTILWVEDDAFYKARVVPMLQVAGFSIIESVNARSAIETLEGDSEVDLVILDVAMPDGGAFSPLLTKAGHETGLLLGGWIHDRYPQLPLVGFSLNSSSEVRQWFYEHGVGYFRKGEEDWTLVSHIKKTLGMGHIRTRGPRVFIVHGHDKSCVEELKKCLLGILHSPDFVILGEEAGEGRTIIEKFEDEAERVDIVFVLLTPDDMGFARSLPKKIAGRARQNVIFELGYFYAKLQRSRGRVIVLSKGDVERPSDISGVEYIDITSGINAAISKIRKELSDWT